jgi:hypothetical protein
VADQGIVVLGIPIPSSSPAFLSVVTVHVAAGLVCTVAGLVAMLSPKRAGAVGRLARRRLWRGWLRVHVTGMAISYILLLTAFYVDNGPHLPLWRSLPPVAHWVGPGLVGIPILVWALLRHTSMRSSSPPEPPPGIH